MYQRLNCPMMKALAFNFCLLSGEALKSQHNLCVTKRREVKLLQAKNQQLQEDNPNKVTAGRLTVSTMTRCLQYMYLVIIVAGSRAPPTALYNEAATLCVTESRPSTSKVNISAKNSYHLNNSIHSQQESKGCINQPSCLRTGWGSNNPRTNKKCTCSNSPFTLCVLARCQYASTLRQECAAKQTKK
ncbi:hypothetical protein FHG87_001018 [Trinorchestia longiramus]|nr:hypothetical protein FHG87_001018 [Trinorchestia longiramus]